MSCFYSSTLDNPFNINVKNDCTDVQALVEICTDDPVDQRSKSMQTSQGVERTPGDRYLLTFP